jgi:adenine-specific DNA-methyltransferase
LPTSLAAAALSYLVCMTCSYNTMATTTTRILRRHARAIASSGKVNCTCRCARNGKSYSSIYGVDIDAQAVEVCQLSLYLKLLQDETTGSAHQYQLEFQHTAHLKRLLPDLSKNIVCGNSLIGTDVLQGQLFAIDEERKLNPMNFGDAFPEIIKRGGFDVIVGNPPYGATFDPTAKAYIRKKFASYKYKYDSYIYFIERALSLVAQGGYLSYITPELWLKLESCAPLRNLIARNASFKSLRIYGEDVFAQAVVNTVVFVLQKGTEVSSILVEHGDEMWQLPSQLWKSDPLLAVDYRLRPELRSLVDSVRAASQPLSEFGEAIQGITPYDRYRGQDPNTIKRRGYHFDHKHDKHCGKWLAGEDIARYELHWSGEWLSYGPWLGAPREPRFFEGPRLLFREIPGEGRRIQATLVHQETFYHGHSITPFKPHENSGVDLRFLLGVANSLLANWVAGLTLANFGKQVFPKLNPQDIKALPIPRLELSKPADQTRHDHIAQHVDAILRAKKQLADAKTDKDKTYYENKCASLDRQIDLVVYDLYELTDREIRTIEGLRDTISSP